MESLHGDKQNPALLEVAVIGSEADSIDTTFPRQTTDFTELVPLENPTADPENCLSRYPIEETELVLSENLNNKTESIFLSNVTELAPAGKSTFETETNILINETESASVHKSTFETETNLSTGGTEFVRHTMAVAAHKDAADDYLGLDYDSDDSIKDPNYIPDTVSSPPPSVPNSPAKITKKRKINPANREIAKKRRNEGLEYTSSTTKKIVKGKKMGPPCAETCNFKCQTKIGPRERQQLFDSYWKLGNLDKQRHFLLKCMEKIAPAVRFTNKNNPRLLNNSFNFFIGDEKKRVCKRFFMNTLGISDRPIRTVLKKTNEMGFLEPEKRGKHDKHYQVDGRIKQSVRDFINGIPRMESHYLRAQTSREYIEGGRSLADLHRDYKKQQDEKGESHANLVMFSKLFNEEFNISFFSPKKDLCNLCEAVKNTPDDPTLTEKYDDHQYEKVLSRISKDLDKDNARENTSFIVACFDLQAVMPFPRGNTSLFYYKSKVNCYNFTITNILNGETKCYFWHQGEGNRGANEIASCIFKYLEELTIKMSDENLEVVFYSDNCCGQNKNKFVMTMFLYAVHHLKIKSITHKFLICGHTQNEGDVAHSVIEKAVKQALKRGPIFLPQQYSTIIRGAKKTGLPYEVKELCYSDFYDIKNLQTQLGNNFDRGINGEKVLCSNIKVVKYEKDKPFSLQVKTSYESEDYLEIVTRKRTRKNQMVLVPAYTTRPRIDAKKKKRLTRVI